MGRKTWLDGLMHAFRKPRHQALELSARDVDLPLTATPAGSGPLLSFLRLSPLLAGAAAPSSAEGLPRTRTTSTRHWELQGRSTVDAQLSYFLILPSSPFHSLHPPSLSSPPPTKSRRDASRHPPFLPPQRLGREPEGQTPPLCCPLLPTKRTWRLRCLSLGSGRRTGCCKPHGSHASFSSGSFPECWDPEVLYVWIFIL